MKSGHFFHMIRVVSIKCAQVIQGNVRHNRIRARTISLIFYKVESDLNLIDKIKQKNF
jgi:hypothetical protein